MPGPYILLYHFIKPTFLGPLSKNCCCITRNGDTIYHKTGRYGRREPEVFW